MADRTISVNFDVVIVDGGANIHGKEKAYTNNKGVKLSMPTIKQITPKVIIDNYVKNAYCDEYHIFEKPKISYIRGNKFSFTSKFKPHKKILDLEDISANIISYIDFDDDGNYPISYNNHSFLVMGSIKPKLEIVLRQGNNDLVKSTFY
uniref:Uncharacterized protein n=1 Tax=viral metagenome TaxID=1070528 RepID=A0A6C0JB76_9ZZZZ